MVAVVQLGHRLLREDATALQLPLLLLLQQQAPHQADDRGVVGEDPDDAGAAFDLLVQTLQGVGAPDLAPVFGWEAAKCQHVFPGLGHQCGGGGELLGEHGDHLIPLLLHSRLVLLDEHRTQGGSDHVPAGFWHFDQQVAGEMDPAALPPAALEAAGDRLLEAGMGVADHQLHPCQPPLPEVPQEGGPEGLVLTVAHLDAEHLALAAGGDANRHDHGPGDHLLARLVTAVEVRRSR